MSARDRIRNRFLPEPQEVTLLTLEWRAYRSMLPRDAASLAYWALALAALLVASLLFFGDGFSAESVFALGALLVLLISLYTGGGMAMTVWENGFREWWLSVPVSRHSLVKAKLIAACGIQYVSAAGIWLVCLGHGAVGFAGQAEAGTTLAGDEFASLALAHALLYAALVPIGTFAGYSLLGMYYGWRRWLLIPWIAILILPFSLFGLVSNLQTDATPYLGAGPVVLYAIVGLMLAALAYRACLWLAVHYGMRDLARHRPGSFAGMGGKRGRQDAAVKSGRVGTGFSALYALERSRYAYWSSIKPVRLIYAGFLLLAGVGGYFGARDPMGLLSALRAMLVIPCIFPLLAITIQMSHEGNKRRLEWWLGLPYPRHRLLLARFIALWAFVLRAAGGLLAILFAGVALSGREGLAYFSHVDRIGSIFYLLTAYLLCGLIVSALAFVQASTLRSSIFGWLYMPVWLTIYFLPGTLMLWAVPETLLAARIGLIYWIRLGAGAALMLAVVPLAIRIGAKWTHLYVYNTIEDRQRRRGEQAFKFRS
ncbi:hypothetical protein [Cohnella hashimotonis]|uniref:ABC transporter permease n=1 Tax=Cohnella hashimotonis TaxID=2826895 RepID=A0ABT6TD33_9BACL|nr:hypothetical protein [Cohnella hashimotonis]MDI4644245.1 hypothetical protein [Cohnella hashimotonis]